LQQKQATFAQPSGKSRTVFTKATGFVMTWVSLGSSYARK